MENAILGNLLTDKECEELDYTLRKELDKMLLDLNGRVLDGEVKEAIINRYKVIFDIYARLASPQDLNEYRLSNKFA